MSVECWQKKSKRGGGGKKDTKITISNRIYMLRIIVVVILLHYMAICNLQISAEQGPSHFKASYDKDI